MIKNISFNFPKKNYVITGVGKSIGCLVLKKPYQSGVNIALITRSKPNPNKDLVKESILKHVQ